MSVSIGIMVFCGSLLLSMAASVVLAERLDQIGDRFRFTAALLGIVTALGADAPEIASAVTAMIGGQHDLGRGVIFGSNIFNVAMLLGFSALVAGRIAIDRRNLAVNAGVSLVTTLIVGAQTAGWSGPLLTGLLLLAVLGPYLAFSSVQPSRLSGLPLPRAVNTWLRSAADPAEADEEGGDSGTGNGRLTLADALSVVPLLSVIVATSIAMVKAAEFLGAHWHVPQIVIGTFVVATLTGIPNLIAAIRLARQGRGSALSSEAFNSNTLNLLAGAYLPTLLVGLPAPSREALLSVLWLLGMTLLAFLLGAVGRGFTRWKGGLLLAAYAAFAVLVIGKLPPFG